MSRRSFRQTKRGLRSYGKYLWATLLLGVLVVLLVTESYSDDGFNPEKFKPRRLAAAAGACDADAQENGALVAPYLLIVLFAFLGLAIVCDEYFEPALQMISEKLGLSEDVAGATFMAAGSSAPELFTSVSDAFFSQNSIGIGTIVGSAMFNILVIVAVSAAVSTGNVLIDWRPVIRDVSFYLGSIGILVMFMINDGNECIDTRDKTLMTNATEILALNGDERGEFIECGWGVIYWQEGLVMVGCYGLYILFMVFNKTILDKCRVADGKVYDASQDGDNAEKVITDGNENGGEAEEDDDEPWYKIPDGVLPKIYWVISLPLVVCLKFTIPNCEEGPFKGWLMTSFSMCILWIGTFCLLMVHLATEIGCILDVDPVIMGIVLLAAGTSVPDLIASMIVAKQGHADMAIANAVGSNVFDILLGLGLPWFMVGPILGTNTLVSTSGIVTEVAILVGTVLLYLGAIIANGWRMNKRIGGILCFLYVCYIIFSLIRESSKH